MKRKLIFITMIVVLLASLVSSLAFAVEEVGDGFKLVRNISDTPDQETEKAALKMMDFYVTAQHKNGELIPVEYFDLENNSIGTRDEAKPLVAVYIDDMAEHHEEDLLGMLGITSGASFGAFDSFASLSLDDGNTWKNFNLSESADKSSFTLRNGYEYPGDTGGLAMTVAGNRVFAAWLSKYCAGGSPGYVDSDDKDAAAEYIYPGIDLDAPSREAVYFTDLFGVAGSQGSVDYTLQGFPEVGEIPYACVWTARGILEPVNADGVYDPDGLYNALVWRQAERLTSGRRDANRIEVAGVSEAGFIITWQEDPEGLRPGLGLGPGEGWSGAVVNGKTDVWYSHIDWDHFDLVQTSTTDAFPLPYADYTSTEMPKVGIPMAVPVRMTDNNKCTLSSSELYCHPDEVEGYELPSFCGDEMVDFTITDPNTGVPKSMSACGTEDNRVLMGRMGASRPRIGMHGYDTDGDGITESAWVLVGYEESKALGLDDPTHDLIYETKEELMDTGKNLWYHSFDMFEPDMVSHGNILNQPAMIPTEDLSSPDPTLPESFYPVENTSDIFGFGDPYDFDFYETEIARRFSLISQDFTDAGSSGLVAYALIKQGILKQGGPADIFGRRFVLPVDFDPTEDNPYDFENMECVYEDGTEAWAYNDDENPHPYYPDGICLAPPTNLSGTTIVECDSDSDCFNPPEFLLGGDTASDGNYPRVVEWRQCGFDYGSDGSTLADIADCEDSNLNDQSWENPYDVAKGHRGFLDGDFLMVMYAWAPNWKANTVGNDHYNLYTRRSFDGGETWTTLPGSFLASDGETYDGAGTTTCENYGVGGGDSSDYQVTTECFEYGAGDFEQSRNVSQLVGNKVTVLDPRYTPTTASILEEEDGSFLYPDDERDPSKFFIIYETGDNSTVEFGEATPLDLFFSRAFNFGDYYDGFECEEDCTVVDDGTLGTDDDGEIANTNTPEDSWYWMEKDEDQLSGEASVTANAGGTFFYSVWNQWQEPEEEVIENSDAMFRRVLYIDELEAWDANSVGLPVATILYQSADVVSWDTEEVVLIGSGQDGDHQGEGIVSVRWWSDIEGHECTERTWKFPPKGLIPGWHGFHFQVQDNEGNWSEPATTIIIVTVDGTIESFLPAIVR